MTEAGRTCARLDELHGLSHRERSTAAKHGPHGINSVKGNHALCCGQVVENSKQAANESWGQLGYPVPDSRPLAADVSAAGHGYESYTCVRHLSR